MFPEDMCCFFISFSMVLLHYTVQCRIGKDLDALNITEFNSNAESRTQFHQLLIKNRVGLRPRALSLSLL